MTCPACQAQNSDSADTCFTCGQPLSGVVKLGTVIASRYRVESPLGRGGMGMVYRAHDDILDETVAIKVLRADVAREADMARRFLSEIKLARQVSHRNVCRIHEYGDDHGLRYISMELIDGVDLKRVLRERGALPAPEAFDVALQVARGLEAIHEAGIVHRDLKTPNIMRDRRGVVRLMDFGIAKQVDADTTGVTGTGQIVGTPEYMSPEQARGERIDQRSDIYALGIVVFEIFTGQVPFRGDTPVATILKHLQEAPQLEGHGGRLPAALVPVLRRALAKEPQARYANVADMAEALQRAREATRTGPVEADLTPTTPVAALGPTAIVPTPVPRRRAKKAALAAVALGLLGAAGAVFVAREPPRAAPTATEVPTPTVRAATAVAAPALNPSPTSSPSPAPAPQMQAAAVPTAPRAERRSTPPAAAAGTIAPPSPAPVTPTSTPVPRVVAAAEPPPPVEEGTLQLLVTPSAEVVVDGQSQGQVATRKLRLAAGPHVVRFVHPDYQPLQRKVTIVAGETAKLVIDLAEDAVRRTP